jgi:hypothetical protein
MSHWTENTAANIGDTELFTSSTGQTRQPILPSSGTVVIEGGVASQIPRQQPGNLGRTGEHSTEVFLRSSREASRSLAQFIPDEEHSELLKRHSSLVEKRFTEGLTRSEELDLQLIRWNLDRIDDAKFGASLDFLERIASSQENLAERITNTLSAMERASYRARNKK